nr:MAG TPA: hypothetical protein [Bacteriophage sp.]
MLLSIAKSMFVFELFHLIHTHTKNPGRCIRVRMFEIFALLRKHEPEHGIIRNITQVFKVPGLFKLGKIHFQTFDCIHISGCKIHSCRSILVIRLLNQSLPLFVKGFGILVFHQCIVHFCLLRFRSQQSQV